MTDRSLDQLLREFVGRPVVRLVGFVIGVAMFGFVVSRAWFGLSAVDGLKLDWTWLAASLLLLCLGEAVTGVGLARAINLLGHPTDVRVGIHVHFATAPARVLPGFLGTTVGRVGVGVHHGLAAKKVAAASLIEPWMSAAVTALLGLLFLREPMAEAGEQVGPAWRLILIAVTGAFVVLVVLATVRYLRGAASESSAGPLPWLLLFLVYLVVWLFFGAALSALIAAVGGEQMGIGHSSAVFAASWLLGFVVILVPGGLGIREGAMALLLGQSVSPELGATVAVLSRLLWWVATGVVFALSLVVRPSDSEMSE